MKRYILLYNGQGEKPDADVQQIRSASGITVLDETSRMLFVEGSDPDLKGVVEKLDLWSLEPERTYRASPPRARLKKTA